MLNIGSEDNDSMGKRFMLPGLLAMAAALASCGGGVYRQERFESDSPYYRAFDATVAAACGASRSALLSQGYLILQSSEARVKANKEFQPKEDLHNDLEFTITCEERGSGAIVYASAIQQRYEVRKVPQSASLSVPKIGSLSLPGGSTRDDLIKTGSETVTDRDFYDRFFARVAGVLAPVPQPSR
jgi:hypothetical protein